MMWKWAAKFIWSTVGSRVVHQVAQQLAESPEFQRFVFRMNQAAVRQLRKFTDKGVYKPGAEEPPMDAAQRAAQQARNSGSTAQQQQQQKTSSASSSSQPRQTPPKSEPKSNDSSQSYFPDEYSPWKRWYLTKKYEYMVWKNSRKGS